MLVGTRLWASDEALGHDSAKARIVGSSGDDTIRGGVVDAVRGYDWPKPFNCRTLRNSFTDEWQDRTETLWAEGDAARKDYFAAAGRGDFDTALVIAGESAGLVRDVEPARAIVERMVADAIDVLIGAPDRFLRLDD